MAKKILIQAKPFKDTFRLEIPSEYNRLKVREMVRTGKTTLFELVPRVRASKSQRGYLEAAVIPAYAEYQYGLDPRLPENAEKARDLFKGDFLSEIIKDRDGNPHKLAESLSGRHVEALDKYMEYAPENGYPIPNESLYKTWRDEYSMDTRWTDYWDWLEYLGLECDSMPTAELLKSKL